MSTSRPLSEFGRAYLVIVITTGLFVILHSLVYLARHPVGMAWFVWAGLTLLSGSFTIKVPTIPARLSVSETFVFAAVLMFGPAAATMVVALDSLVISLWSHKSSRRGIRVFFNLSAPTIAVWIAAQLFFWLAAIQPLEDKSRPILPLLVPLLVLAIIYFLLNSWLIALAVAFEQKSSSFTVWRQNFLWLSLNYFSGASVAGLLLPYLQGPDQVFGFVRGIALLLPLLVISYLTFKTSLGRVEDANRHLSELNRLYLSTIETLAMAIDAKDQITHGHIRRVQIFAIGLAKAMGVNDSVQIRAVEAAALLHDMGKLAVPEHILNKPGPLSAAEFDKMKLHASVGADILSAIDFPYPVVPIVRHHHENWDGTGYPDGLKGSDIPIGARILSVVDCFDALTSDRPYRLRLSDEAAIEILRKRRGTMYDPLVVDTFIKIYRRIAPIPEDPAAAKFTTLPVLSRVRMPEASENAKRSDQVNASHREMLALYEIVRCLSGRFRLSELTEAVATQLRHVLPATTYALFVYDQHSDQLVPAHATGLHSSTIVLEPIPLGQRLSGWVAANRQTVINSDPMLDLGEAANLLRPGLRSCMSTPLLTESELVGVLTVYALEINAFNEEHRRFIQTVANQLSLVVRHAMVAADALAKSEGRLPSDTRTPAFDREPVEISLREGTPTSLLLLDLNRVIGHSTHQANAEDTVEKVAVTVRNSIRLEDLMFRLDFDRLLILLPHTDAATAETVAAASARRIEPQFVTDRSRSGLPIGRATAPADGMDLPDLVRVAEARIALAPFHNSESIH